jgi:hypothetical protein
MTKKKVIVEFIFETNGKEEEADRVIKEIIYSDMNFYFQSDYVNVSMESLDIKQIENIE